MTIVTVHQAKTQLSKLIARAEAGEDIVIARGSKPAVRLIPVGKQVPKRQFGSMKGLYKIPDAFFFDPLPEDELKLYEGTDDDEVPAR
jgi:prevent-host-death family protein